MKILIDNHKEAFTYQSILVFRKYQTSYVIRFYDPGDEGKLILREDFNSIWLNFLQILISKRELDES